MDKEKIRSWLWNGLGIVGVLFLVFGVRPAWHTVRSCIGEVGSFIEYMVKKESWGRSVWKAANGQDSSESIMAWLEQNAAKSRKSSRFILLATDPFEDFELNLKRGRGDGLSYVQIRGKNLEISGRIDGKRKYFEGNTVWKGKEVYLLDCESKEYMLLKWENRSCMIGDYYIYTRFFEEKNEMELLIFYCA